MEQIALARVTALALPVVHAGEPITGQPFATRYYNVDMHNAALALPEFMREALGE